MVVDSLPTSELPADNNSWYDDALNQYLIDVWTVDNSTTHVEQDEAGVEQDEAGAEQDEACAEQDEAGADKDEAKTPEWKKWEATGKTRQGQARASKNLLVPTVEEIRAAWKKLLLNDNKTD